MMYLTGPHVVLLIWLHVSSQSVILKVYRWKPVCFKQLSENKFAALFYVHHFREQTASFPNSHLKFCILSIRDSEWELNGLYSAIFK